MRIIPHVAPLDEFSFPSGHTLHAVSFTHGRARLFPAARAAAGAVHVAGCASRIVLGLHYPSDVLAATVIGCVLAGTSLWILNYLLRATTRRSGTGYTATGKTGGQQIATRRCFPVDHFAGAEHAREIFQHQMLVERIEAHTTGTADRFVDGLGRSNVSGSDLSVAAMRAESCNSVFDSTS